LRRGFVAALLAMSLAASGPATAQALYRWTDAQGKTHFGDRPPKDAIGLTRVDTGGEGNTLPATPLPPAPSSRSVPAAAEALPAAPAGDRATQRRDTRERLRADLNRALQNLEAAKKKLADGDDMEEDERQTVQQRGGRPPATPTARQNCRTETGPSGKPVLMCPVTVPNERYYDRIARLEEAVRQAEAEVAAAESAYRRGVD
jgi:uncharacterized protein DUF4124